MYGIFNKPFKDITQEDINRLITDNERESLYLEYKETLKLDDIAVDVCAMANAQGGYIVIGISEKTENPDGEGYPDQIKPIDDARNQEIRLRDKVKDTIDPQIPGFHLRLVEVTEGFVILAEIPNSMIKPHFVAHSKYRPFPLRVARATSYWTMGDVRSQIISRSDPEIRVKKKVNEIIQKGPLSVSTDPYLTLIALPTFFGNETIDLKRNDVRQIVENPPGFTDPLRGIGGMGSFVRPCLEGIESVQEFPSSVPKVRRYLRLHRSGILEYSQGKLAYDSNGSIIIRGDLILEKLVHHIFTFSELAKLFELYDPVTFSMQICKLNNHEFHFFDNGVGWDDFYKPLEESTDISIIVSYPSAFEKGIAFDMCLRFFNAFGFDNLPKKIEKLLTDLQL